VAGISLFVIGALRAIVEMLLLCLVAQAILYLLAGQKRSENPIYRLFALITKPPRRLVSMLLPTWVGSMTVAAICFLFLLFLWLGLALMRKFI